MVAENVIPLLTLLLIKDTAKLCNINHLKKIKFLIINLVGILNIIKYSMNWLSEKKISKK